MKLRFVCSIAFLMFLSVLFAGADPFTAKLGNSKHEIVDSLLAVDELSGSIYYQQNYLTVDSNWQEGETYIGDYYDWGWMTRFASIGYLSFELPQIPDGYHLQSAHLMMYIGAMKGNSTSGVYPIFDYGNTSIYPEGILEHIDYGDTFNSIDVIPSTVYSTYTFFDLESLSPPCWVSYDVTDCLLLDSAENRSLTQYRIYLNGFSDWDNREDYIATSTGSSTYYQNSAKISYALSDGVSNIDPSIPQPQLTISCYPNPFSDKSSIKVKAHEPGLYKLNIYNIKGQLIRSYGNSSKPSGDHIFHWDGRDDTGRQVSGGIYFAVVEASKYKASSKILYVR
ncbi:MAG TPA: FlgD immunoglobulin-like domain containing protein [Candidatus Cloacimonadota bacterium]|nr:FlgD immunoglobulin-like domain containing protein [Candidatus Cloacimonadota bacterium]